MTKVIRKVGIYGFSTITALLLSFGMIFMATYFSSDVSAGNLCCSAFTCKDGTRFGEDYNYGGSSCSERLKACDSHGGFNEGGGQMSCSIDNSCGGLNQSCCSGNGCISGLLCYNGKCTGSVDPGGQYNCKSSCGVGGCSVSGTCHPDVKKGAAYCRGRSFSACNDAHGSYFKGNSTGNIDASNPENWCSTVQADVSGPYVQGPRAVVVFIGDNGTTCVEGTSCNPDKLDWDCSRPPVVPPVVPPVENNKPVCEGLIVSKTKVTSLNEQITVTVKGSDPDNIPLSLSVEAAAAGQINRNPGNLSCVFTPISHPEYSFYCGGQKVWKNIASAGNTNSYTFTTTYKNLMDKVNSINSGFVGNLQGLGIQLSANIVGSNSTDLCSANIARNNGNGAYFAGGAWNQTCVAKSCNVRITYQPPAPVNKPPVCEWLKVDKQAVFSLDEKVTISVRGTDPENTPQKLALFAAAGSQVNSNPADFDCVGTPTTHPEYSFYCRGTASWVQIGSRINANEMQMTTTYRNLMKMIDGLNSGYQGKLVNNGINITANITGSSSVDICSSNIARNNGNGVYFNNGAWNQACDGGCNALIKYYAPAPPEELKVCNESCTNTSQCDGSNQCINGLCRNASCADDADCTCDIEPPIALKCNAECTSNSQCVDGNQCISGYCRNAACSDETDCTCPTKPSEPYCGDKTCNQSSEMCENGVSCINGGSVACRTDCTYCGDGKVNGGEQCDYNAAGQAENCSKECKWIEHEPEDTAGLMDNDIAMFGGIGLLAMGMGSIALAAPLKKRVRFEMS